MLSQAEKEEDILDNVFDDEVGSYTSDTLPPLSAENVVCDYVLSRLANPRKFLASAADRSAFIAHLLGDVSLANEARNDSRLRQQVRSRAVVLISHIRPAITSADEFDTDAFVAILAHVAAKWPILIETLEVGDVAGTVINVMQRFHHHPCIIARSLTALRVFAVTDSMRKRIMLDRGVDATLYAMGSHENDHRVQYRAAGVLANLSFGCPHRKRRIARQGGLKKIVDSMLAFPDDESIQLRGALTIRNITHEAQVNQYIAGNQGAVGAVGTAMLTFQGVSADTELRFQCVMALESLCREDEENRLRLLAMEGSIHSVPNCLTTSTSLVDNSTSRNAEEVVNEDGDVIVEEQELGPVLNPNIRQRLTLCPDRSLICPRSSLSSSSNRESVGIISHQEESNLSTRRYSRLLTNESPSAIHMNRRGTASVIRAIVNSIRRAPDNQLLLKTALSLLLLISNNRPLVQIRLGALNGVEVAIAAIRRHPRSEVVVGRACALLSCLCLQKANRDKICSGLQILISAAKDQTRNPRISVDVVSALGNAVFEHGRNRSLVLCKQGVEAIVSTIAEAGHCDTMVLEASVCALRNIVYESRSAALVIARDGGVRAAVTALDSTKSANTTGEQSVQEQSVKLLADIARLHPRSKQEMIKIDAADWIENALAKLSVVEFPEFHKEGDHLVSLLAKDHDEDKNTKGAHKNFSRKSSPSDCDRKFLRGMMSGLLQMGRKRKGSVKGAKREVVGRSMPLRNEAESKKRLSTRLFAKPFS